MPTLMARAGPGPGGPDMLAYATFFRSWLFWCWMWKAIGVEERGRGCARARCGKWRYACVRARREVDAGGWKLGGYCRAQGSGGCLEASSDAWGCCG